MEHCDPPIFAAAAVWSDVPLGVSRFDREILLMPKLWNHTLCPIVFEAEHGKGGHFEAYEWPYAIVQDMSSMFAKSGGTFGVVAGEDGYSHCLILHRRSHEMLLSIGRTVCGGLDKLFGVSAEQYCVTFHSVRHHLGIANLKSSPATQDSGCMSKLFSSQPECAILKIEHGYFTNATTLRNRNVLAHAGKSIRTSD
jgi:hypothetical protein